MPRETPPASTATSSYPLLKQLREVAATDQGHGAPAGPLGALFATGLSAMLLWGSVTPVGFGPLAWIALIPLFALLRLERPVRRMSAAVYIGGLGFWLATLQWMRLGDRSMYVAWFALSLYLALYFPLFVALARIAVWRLHVPVTLAAPVVWVGLELLRGYLLTGFSWYYLAHTQYRWIELIQISDVVGAYGVSFLVALVSGCAAELLPVSWIRRLGLLPLSAGPAGMLAVSTREVRCAWPGVWQSSQPCWAMAMSDEAVPNFDRDRQAWHSFRET